MHGFYSTFVAFHNLVYRSSTFHNITINDANQTVIGIGVDKYFQVHHLAQLGIGKYQNSLYNDYMAGCDGNSFGGAGASEIGVDGLFNSLALFKRFQMFH